jgi:hypothetical protein
MVVSVSGEGRNSNYLFIFVEPALQIAERIAAKLEIVPGKGSGGKGAALAAACNSFLSL